MRITHNLIVALFLIAFYNGNAQLTVDWLGQIGGPENDYGYAMAVDSNENVFVAGRFRGQVSFDPNSNTYDFTAVDLGDAYIQKFDANGNFLWAKVFLNDSSSIQRPLITVDQNDNVIISGKFEDQIDLDPGPGSDIRVSSGWGDNTYIVKLNNNGSYLWGNVFDNTSSNQIISAQAMSIDNFGNILISGNFQSTIDFDFGPNTFSMTGSLFTGFILKLDTNGNFVWAKQFSGQSPRVYFSCIKFDSQNNIIAGGAFSGFNFIDFDPGSNTFNVNTPENPNSHKIFVLKLSENGDFIWVKSADGYSSTTMNAAGDRVHSIVVDENDNILFTGGFRNNINFDPGSTAFALDSGTNGCNSCLGYKTGYLAKTDSGGNMLWAKKIEGNNFVASIGNGQFYEHHIVLNSNQNGQVFLGLTLRGTINYEINNVSYNYYTGSPNGWEISFFEIDPITGDYLSAHFVPSSANTFVEKISFVGNDLYAVGSFRQQLFFDSNSSITPTGLSDAFAVKFVDVTTLSSNSFKPVTVKAYPNPTSGLVNLKSNSLIDKIEVYDMLGKILISKGYTNPEVEVNLSELPKGVYFTKIHTGDTVLTAKLIKN